ncbi:MAG: ribosome maturation factor RimP [Mesorhizobium amorphae]|nr:MAG: ribosome maturation factor RimP [Mesorhizobium amorphae]
MTADTPFSDDRLIREHGTDARVAAIVGPVLGPLGYRLVRVRVSGQNGLTLQIMAERSDGTMTVEDCETVSRAISPVLEAADPIPDAYHLEVSSPGIDRPLVRASDFGDWAGHIVKLETSVMVEGRKRFRGKIAEASETSVTIERDAASYGDAPTVAIPLDAVSDARLVLTDELIRESLAKDKKARQAAKRGEAANENDEPETDDSSAEG